MRVKDLMSSIIKDSLKGKESVITHSPWGDYGNIEHINVFDSTFKACQSIGVALYCFGYSSQYPSVELNGADFPTSRYALLHF